jgi:phospholipid/cholesterol/gamma-HCH transport system substrate-binding protein
VIRRWLVVAAVLALSAGACSIETAGAPTGEVSLYATFDDVQDLTPGHNVQASNVVVGSVAGIELDGYQARVELSIVDDFRVPDGVAAVVRKTSLLGEYYVDLVLPEHFDPEAGPFLGDGDVIEEASTQPDVEQLAEQAASVVGALTADDLGSTINAAATGLDGRGQVLHDLVRDAGLVLDALADQQTALASTVDSMGELGATLAPRAGELATTIGKLAAASGTLADSRDKIVAAVDALVELATTTNDTVIEPHAERLITLLSQLEPMLGTLSDRSDVLAGLIVDLGRFVELFPSTVHKGNVLLLTWAFVPGALRDLTSSSIARDPLEAVAQLAQRAGGTP